MQPGKIRARVSGGSLYTIDIRVEPLEAKRWKSIRASRAGRIDTLVELLQGRIADDVMRRMCDRATGLFPVPAEIRMECSCPDYATMCKHVAAALYGVGARLDARPELLFTLRGVDHLELVEGAASAAVPSRAAAAEDALQGSDLSALFGIDLAAPARAGEKAAESDELFAPGEEVHAGDLIAIGIPRSTFGNWVTSGVLARTRKRGVYLATAALNDKALTFLAARQ